jgi:hypothetical protein
MENKKTCVYCGSKDRAMSVEHVIPKSLFSKENRKNLVTVPCCTKCNNSFGKDVEYFKNMLLLREDVANQPTVKSLADEVQRALLRREKEKFTSNLLNTTKEVEVVTHAGIYAGKKRAYKIDMDIINAVIQRSIRGLYYSHTKRIIPFDYIIRVVEKKLSEGLNNHDKNFIMKLEKTLSMCKEHSIGNNTIKYKFVVSDGEDFCSLWKATFFENVVFWGAVTTP